MVRIGKNVIFFAVGASLLCSSCHGCASDAGPSATPQTPPPTSSYRPGYIALKIDGMAGGKELDGVVQSEALKCQVESQGAIGNLYHIIWSGRLDPGDILINGEIIGPLGTSTFGSNPVNPPPNKIANSNVNVAGTRVGGGLTGGTGTLTMVSPTIGNIHVNLNAGGGQLFESGDWDCTAGNQ